MAAADRSIGDQLAEWGKAVILESRGRVTGRPVRAAVGFLEEADGSLLVAAGDARTQWARNLLADPHCIVERDGVRVAHDARLLDDDSHHAVVTGLILRYGTPAERLGAGPAFRLVPEQH
jgi:deazaflavin-dependent oxidoreductase (nitroreductase family)